MDGIGLQTIYGHQWCIIRQLTKMVAITVSQKTKKNK
jgi:hypothetical protein